MGTAAVDGFPRPETECAQHPKNNPNKNPGSLTFRGNYYSAFSAGSAGASFLSFGMTRFMTIAAQAAGTMPEPPKTNCTACGMKERTPSLLPSP